MTARAPRAAWRQAILLCLVALAALSQQALAQTAPPPPQGMTRRPPPPDPKAAAAAAAASAAPPPPAGSAPPAAPPPASSSPAPSPSPSPSPAPGDAGSPPPSPTPAPPPPAAPPAGWVQMKLVLKLVGAPYPLAPDQANAVAASISTLTQPANWTYRVQQPSAPDQLPVAPNYRVRDTVPTALPAAGARRRRLAGAPAAAALPPLGRRRLAEAPCVDDDFVVKDLQACADKCISMQQANAGSKIEPQYYRMGTTLCCDCNLAKADPNAPPAAPPPPPKASPPPKAAAPPPPPPVAHSPPPPLAKLSPPPPAGGTPSLSGDPFAEGSSPSTPEPPGLPSVPAAPRAPPPPPQALGIGTRGASAAAVWWTTDELPVPTNRDGVYYFCDAWMAPLQAQPVANQLIRSQGEQLTDAIAGGASIPLKVVVLEFVGTGQLVFNARNASDASTTVTSSGGSGSLSAGAIAGVVAGAVGVIALISVGAVLIARRINDRRPAAVTKGMGGSEETQGWRETYNRRLAESMKRAEEVLSRQQPAEPLKPSATRSPGGRSATMAGPPAPLPTPPTPHVELTSVSSGAAPVPDTLPAHDGTPLHGGGGG